MKAPPNETMRLLACIALVLSTLPLLGQSNSGELRLKVTDLASNVTSVETPGPVVVDLIEPEVTNVGVSRPGAPQ